MGEHRELPRLLRKLLGRTGKPSPIGVEERLRVVEQGLREVRDRLNWLLLWMSGVVLAQVLLQLMGKG